MMMMIILLVIVTRVRGEGLYTLLRCISVPLYYIVFFFSGLHHYECVAPLVLTASRVVGSGSGRTASVHDSPWESRSFCTVVILVICGHPRGLFQYTEGEEVKICSASTLSSIRAICPNRVRRRSWIISVSRGRRR